MMGSKRSVSSVQGYIDLRAAILTNPIQVADKPFRRACLKHLTQESNVPVGVMIVCPTKFHKLHKEDGQIVIVGVCGCVFAARSRTEKLV